MPIAALPAIAAGIGAVGSAVSLAKGLSGPSQSSVDQAGQQAADYRQQAADLWKNLNLPNLNTTPYGQQNWLQDYTPEAYDPYIGQVTQMSDDPVARAAQAQSLAHLQELSKPGLLPSDLVQLDQIQRAQAQAGTSAGATAADALRNRGLGGAGAEYAARLAGNQNAANNTSNLYDQALQTALNRQLTATNNAGNLATSTRGQSSTISQDMANINNQFNTQVQSLRTNAAMNAANVRNQAQSANLAGRQSVANANVGIQNTNLDRQNQIQQQLFNDQNTKISGQTNALNGQSNLASAQQAALGQQRAGADQSLSAGLTGLTNVAKSAGNIDWQGILGNNNNSDRFDVSGGAPLGGGPFQFGMDTSVDNWGG